MIQYFKSQHPQTIAVFVLFFCLIKLPFLIAGAIPVLPDTTTLWGYSGLLLTGSPIFNILLAQFILLLQAFWFNHLFHRAAYHDTVSMVPALYFTLVTSLLPEFNVLSVYLLWGILLLWIFHSLLVLSERKEPRVEVFNAGVLVGILLLCYPSFLLLLPFFLFILFIITTFRWANLVLYLSGIVFVLYMTLGFCYVADISVQWEGIALVRNPDWLYLPANTLSWVPLFSSLVLLLFSFISMRGIMYSSGIRRRKNVNLLIFLFLGLSAVIVMSGQLKEAGYMMLFIPVSTFLSLFMLRIRKNRIGEILNAIFVCVIFVTNLIRFFF